MSLFINGAFYDAFFLPKGVVNLPARYPSPDASGCGHFRWSQHSGNNVFGWVSSSLCFLGVIRTIDTWISMESRNRSETIQADRGSGLCPLLAFPPPLFACHPPSIAGQDVTPLRKCRPLMDVTPPVVHGDGGSEVRWPLWLNLWFPFLCFWDNWHVYRF